MKKIKMFSKGWLMVLTTIVIGVSCQKKSEEPEPIVTPYESKAYVIQLATNPAPVLPANFNDISRYNFYGITWDGVAADNLAFAKQMGYTYVMYQWDMEKNALAKDLYFMLEGPDAFVDYTLGIERYIHLDQIYTPAQISTYKNYFIQKDTAAVFPNNMATAWWEGNSFAVEPDWQQKRVRDHYATAVMAYTHLKEKPENNFLFGGFAWDVPNLTGDFWLSGNSASITLTKWTGKESSVTAKGTTHDYEFYGDGKAAYFIAMREAQKKEYPNRLLNTIYEPFGPYGYVKEVEKLDLATQTKLLQGVFLSQECGTANYTGITGTEFVDDARLYASGLLSRDRAGSSTPDNHTLATNLNIAQKAAMNGAWFNWYGRFSGSGDKQPIKHIYEVPNWLQLVRVVANWDNLNGVPLSKRTQNFQSYTSTNSQMDNNIIYSRQPKTQKLFAVFLNNTGEIKLNPGESIVSIKRVNKIFAETIDGKNDLIVEGNTIKLRK